MSWEKLGPENAMHRNPSTICKFFNSGPIEFDYAEEVLFSCIHFIYEQAQICAEGCEEEYFTHIFWI